MLRRKSYTTHSWTRGNTPNSLGHQRRSVRRLAVNLPHSAGISKGQTLRTRRTRKSFSPGDRPIGRKKIFRGRRLHSPQRAMATRSLRLRNRAFPRDAMRVLSRGGSPFIGNYSPNCFQKMALKMGASDCVTPRNAIEAFQSRSSAARGREAGYLRRARREFRLKDLPLFVSYAAWELHR